jgi:hypothetical protein
MKIIVEPYYKEEFKHVIEHDGIAYVREETILHKDFHTINWRLLEDEYEESIEYYSKKSGWSKDSKCHPSNPIPEIEQIFQEKYGININKKNYHYI